VEAVAAHQVTAVGGVLRRIREFSRT
jgi:hypothetical protein